MPWQIRADRGGMGADARGEDQGVQPAQHRRQGPQVLPRQVAVKLDRLGGMGVFRLAREQIADIRTAAGDADQPGTLVHQVVDRGGRAPLFHQQVDKHAGIEVSAPRAHHQAAGGRESHRGIDADTAADGRHAGAVAQVGDDQPAVGRLLRRPPRGDSPR